MAMLDLAGQLGAAREALKQIGGRRSYMLRVYQAEPADCEQISDEDLKCEFVDGGLIVHSPAWYRHEKLVSFVNALLVSFVGKRRLATVLGSNAVMQLG